MLQHTATHQESKDYKVMGVLGFRETYFDSENGTRQKILPSIIAGIRLQTHKER